MEPSCAHAIVMTHTWYAATHTPTQATITQELNVQETTHTHTNIPPPKPENQMSKRIIDTPPYNSHTPIHNECAVGIRHNPPTPTHYTHTHTTHTHTPPQPENQVSKRIKNTLTYKSLVPRHNSHQKVTTNSRSIQGRTSLVQEQDHSAESKEVET